MGKGGALGTSFRIISDRKARLFANIHGVVSAFACLVDTD